MILKSIHRSRFLLSGITAILFSLFCHSPAQAVSQAFSGVTISITIHKSCKEKPENPELVFVFDGEPESASSGWFYGKNIMAAELRKISPMRYEVIYSSTQYHKLPPSLMELQRTNEGFRAVIFDHIPEDKAILDDNCFFEKMEANLTPTKDSLNNTTIQAKARFSSEIIMVEGEDFLLNRKDFRKAESQGRKALAVLEPVFGKLSKESLQAAGLVAWALTEMGRFDEALEIITPYRKSMPDDKILKEYEEVLQKVKKEQDDLFRYDPDSKSDVDLEPLG